MYRDAELDAAAAAETPEDADRRARMAELDEAIASMSVVVRKARDAIPPLRSFPDGTVIRLLDEDPRYVQAQDALSRLSGERRQVEKELQTARSQRVQAVSVGRTAARLEARRALLLGSDLSPASRSLLARARVAVKDLVPERS